MAYLAVEELSKRFRHVQALNNVSFTIPQGSVFGILGPNGSGKTTLLAILLGILFPNHGQITLENQPIDGQARQKIGALLETPNFYPYLNAKRNLKITAAIKGVNDKKIEEVIHQVGLSHSPKIKFKNYSLGMKRRLAIAATLLSDAEIIILDEPTNGLDAMGIADVRNLIKSLHHEGKTIILASHILDEVEKVCTDVAILRKGVVINSGAVTELLAKEDILVVAAQNMEALKTAIRALYPAATLVNEDSRLALFLPKGEVDLAKVNQFCYEKGIVLSHLQLKTKSLETTFLELAKG